MSVATRAWASISPSRRRSKNRCLRLERRDYYAVDHTPSYLWESASRSISAALIVHLPDVVDGRAGWQKNETIRRAVNIDAGVVVKPTILSFQNRKPDYPLRPLLRMAGMTAFDTVDGIVRVNWLELGRGVP